MLDGSPPPFRDPGPGLRAVAFYLPQFHPTPENDAFWGAGFSEWRNVVQARPRFRGHGQPHLPADLGFYDLRLAETRVAQAEMARAAGLSGFCYYHYWFGGRRVLHRPVDDMLSGAAPDFPFMLCWANENWTRAWDGGSRQVILAQSYSDADTRAHARHLARAFHDPRAIRVNGRPVFAVYAPSDLPDARRWSDIFRETCAEDGLDPYLVAVERHLDRDTRPPAEKGFDAALEFQPFSRSFADWQRSRATLGQRLVRRLTREVRRVIALDRHIDMEAFVAFDLSRPRPAYTTFPGLCPSWDNSARRPRGRAIIFRGSSPALFERWTREKTRAFAPPSAEENLVFVNAWNEWAEGNHLEPCLGHGHAWLDALRAGLGASVVRTQAML